MEFDVRDSNTSQHQAELLRIDNYFFDTVVMNNAENCDHDIELCVEAEEVKNETPCVFQNRLKISTIYELEWHSSKM